MDKIDGLAASLEEELAKLEAKLVRTSLEQNYIWAIRSLLRQYYAEIKGK
jgi:hypothetical protein